MYADAEHLDADMRRAYAILTHYSGNDRTGINAVIEEAEQSGRVRPLIWCLAGALAALSPSWHSPEATAVLRAFTTAFAVREHDGGAQ
jgi:hypothetical protein